MTDAFEKAAALSALLVTSTGEATGESLGIATRYDLPRFEASNGSGRRS